MQVTDAARQIADSYTNRVPMQFWLFWEIITDIPNYRQRPSLRHASLAIEMREFNEWATTKELQQFVQFCEELAANPELSEDDLLIVREVKTFVEENTATLPDELKVIAKRSIKEEMAYSGKLFDITMRMLGPTMNELVLSLRQER